MAITFDYSKEYTLTFTNALTACKVKACDAGTPATKVLMLYDDAIKCPGLKWDYLFNFSLAAFILVSATWVICPSPL